MAKRRPLLLLVAFVAAAAGYLLFARGAPPVKPPKPALRQRPKTQAELPTTSAAIYTGNLDGQIAELTRLLNDGPKLVSNMQMLAGLHHTRGRYKDDLDEIQAGIDLLSECVRLEPKNAGCMLVRAEQEQSLHRFVEAAADVDAAAAAGADATRVRDLRAELDWNAGRYDAAIPVLEREHRERPSSATWIRLAQLDHDLGRDDDSDAAFEVAEDLITDTSPLPVAHLYVQRGIQKASRGQLEAAALFFREAAARMPEDVAATDHLAETLHALGKDEEATALYETLTHETNDPEFLHALSVLYAAHGKPDDARALEDRARAGYAALLAKYPNAMYWHASEYYLATGDAKTARDLLEKNLALRPNSTSYVALARADLAVGDRAAAKAAIEKALAMPVKSASLFWTASRVRRAGGDAAAADDLAARAKALNPRIDRDEPAP